MSREDQGHVTVFIGRYNAAGALEAWPGLGDMGVWENRTGGTGGADSTKHREGSMGQLKSYGGPQTMENAQVAKRYDFIADHPKIKTIYAARGRAVLVIKEQPLDEYGNAFGDTVTRTGKLLEVNEGDVNANSGDIRMLVLTQDTEQLS